MFGSPALFSLGGGGLCLNDTPHYSLCICSVNGTECSENRNLVNSPQLNQAYQGTRERE